MTWDPEVDGELQGGASNSEEFEMVFGHHGQAGITQAEAARIADEVMADTSGPESTPKPGPRRNRHLDGDGYGEGR
jgi:hypothetical protein